MRFVASATLKRSDWLGLLERWERVGQGHDATNRHACVQAKCKPFPRNLPIQSDNHIRRGRH